MELEGCQVMLIATESGPLPNYDNPPVVETVVGVQFDRLSGFKNAHLGAFWKTLDGDEWPTVADAPPLAPQFERFTEATRWERGIRLQFTQDPAFRLQIRNKDNDGMIQIQNGRLHFNWLGEGGQNFPRYEKMRDGFKAALERFIQFLRRERIGEFRPNQWEVTYVNHIPKGTVWTTPGDWGFFQALTGVPSVEGIVHGESLTGEWHFVIPEERGRLHVEWRHGLKTDAEVPEMIVLTFTARGPIAESGRVIEGVDLGRCVIVRAFAALMSKGANDFWGLKNAASS